MTVQQRRLIKLSEVEAKVTKTRSWIYAEIRAGRFPRQVVISRSSVAWVEGEIDAWIEERIAERDREMEAA